MIQLTGPTSQDESIQRLVFMLIKIKDLYVKACIALH